MTTTPHAELPELPPFDMQEVNELANLPSLDPFKGKSPLEWYSPETMRAYGEQCAQAAERALLARLGEQQPVAALLGEIRALCEETRKNPGKPVAMPATVEAEFHKFMRDEPSLFDQLTHGQMKAITEAAEVACDVPPEGWHCTRGKGHAGPCAAHPSPAPVGAQERDALAVARAAKTVSDWMAGGCSGEPPRPQLAVLHTLCGEMAAGALAARSAAQGAAQGPQWVSVHDAMPQCPDDDDVPVWTWDGIAVNEDAYGPIFEQPAGPAVGGWVNVGHGFANDTMGRVTHWLPRTKPAAPSPAGERTSTEGE